MVFPTAHIGLQQGGGEVEPLAPPIERQPPLHQRWNDDGVELQTLGLVDCHQFDSRAAGLAAAHEFGVDARDRLVQAREQHQVEPLQVSSVPVL